MDNDQLKNWVDQNRKTFDEIEEPDLDNIWKQMPQSKVLQSKMAQSNKEVNRLPWIIVALLSISVIGLIVVNTKLKIENANPIEEYFVHFPDQKIHRDELVFFVSQKEKAVAKAGIKQEDYNEIYAELEELDQIQSDLKIDFEKFDEKEKMMEMLFKYYERKARILEILLKEIEKKNKHEKNNHEEIY